MACLDIAVFIFFMNKEVFFQIYIAHSLIDNDTKKSPLDIALIRTTKS
jgi:hypothetical protein